MTRMSLLSSPLLLGFEEMERLIDRVGKGDGYPPYNIERIAGNGAGNGDAAPEPMDRLRITLAVAGFRRDQLEITVEDNQLVIRGRQEDDKAARIHPPRHRCSPVQPLVRAGRGHRGESPPSSVTACCASISCDGSRTESCARVEIGATENLSRSGHSAEARIAGR